MRKAEKYKTMVIDFKQLCKSLSLWLAYLIIFVIFLFSFGRSPFLSSRSPERIISDSNPIAGAISCKYTSLVDPIEALTKNLCFILTGHKGLDQSRILSDSLPILKSVTERKIISLNKEYPLDYTPKAKETDPQPTTQIEISPENRAPIKVIDASQRTSASFPVAIGNETSYGVDISDMLNKTPDIDMKKGGPKVLITHTHATEAYAEADSEVYDITASDRSEDSEKNVVRIGTELASVLNERGIETLHDTVLHDVPSFNGSYAHSLSTVNEYLSKHPTIQIVFDIHRDSIVYDDNTKAKVMTNINGKNAAQLMFVVGTDEKGLYNPDWRENIKTAIHFQKEISNKYPKLMRHINLRKERFNGHTTHASMIIEVGTSGNTLDEALYSIQLAGECIADYLKTL